MDLALKPGSNQRKAESPLLRLSVTLLHLAIWSFFGTITRIFLDKFFQLGCSGGWGPCLEGGVYFSSLPSNILGSFVMGTLATSAQIGIAGGRPVAILSESHPWQRNAELQIGMRTGYCGSLTTFGGWISEVFTNAIHHNAWMNAVGAVFVGTASALASFTIGTHVALAFDRFVHSANALESSLEFRIAQVSEVLRPDAPREDVVGDEQRSVMDEAGDIPRGSIGSEQRGHREGPVNEKMVVAPRSDLLATGAVIVVVAALACGVALETRHDWLRTAWFACLLAPLGTWLRWQLAVRANYRAIAGRGSWFPWGTLIANMLGTALTAGMAALQLRGDLGYWGRILSGATADGFCGALTTVSTLVAELAKFSETFPKQLHVYTYALATMSSGVAAVFASYAWAPWS